MKIEIIGPENVTKALKDKIETEFPGADVADTNETDPRILALAMHLDCEPDDISETVYGENEYDAPGGEYLVLTDDEADERAEEYIKDSVWAFNASFLQGYGAFRELGADDINRLRGDKCETINDAFVRMIGSDWDSFVADAIGADGRGHFLNHYDGNEYESGDYFIYQTN